MARFIARVELHNATYSDYETLHAAMQQEGFSRFIQADSGAFSHLPTAMYHGDGNVTSVQALEGAKRAAATTGKSFEAIAIEMSSAAWYNLTPAS